MRKICDFRPLNSAVAKRTIGEYAEYLTTAVVGAGKVVFLSVRDANDVTVLRDRFTALLLFGPQGGVARGISSGVLLRFRAGPSGVFWQGARADGRQMARRDSGRVDGLALPGRVAHTVIHSPRLDHPPMVVKDGVGGAWVLSESTEDYVLGTEVTSFLSRSSVIGLHGLFLLNGVCVRAEWVKHDETVQYVQDRLGLRRRLLRPEMSNVCAGSGKDSSGSALDGVVTPRRTPAADTSDAALEAVQPFPQHWPRCEICATPTRNVACPVCGIRVCSRCERNGAECMCHGEAFPIRAFLVEPDGVDTPRWIPAVDTSDARVLGIETDAHGEAIRAFPEAIKLWKAKKKGEEGELVEQQRQAQDTRTRGRGRGNG